jgi:hypothetical protein
MNAKWIGMVAGIVGCALAVRAGEKSNDPIRVSMDLTDGSRLIGTVEETSFRFVSAIGKIELPQSQIKSIQFNTDRETAAIRLRNNDQLSGVLDLRALYVQTLFGKVEVPLAQCRKIAFLGGGKDGGLVLHYTFDNDDEMFQERSGRGNNAYWVGDPLYEDGVKGRAACFRNKDTYFMSSAPELDMNGWNEMTVSLWVSMKGQTTYGHVINRGTLTTDKVGAFFLAVGNQYGKGSFGVQNDSGRPCPTVIAPGSLPLNRWCHLAGTYDGETMRYYVDGQLEKETRISDSPAAIAEGPGNKLVIGNVSTLPYINWSDMYFNGLVDEVRIYRRALSQEEIKQIGKSPK